METENQNAEDIYYSGEKKVVSFRCNAEFKNRLCSEALQRGITTSELIEHLLFSQKSDKASAETLKKENNEIRAQLANTPKPPDTINNPVLLQLFEQVKGREDIVEAPDGKRYKFVYNTPLDLLTSMIYSYKLKNQ